MWPFRRTPSLAAGWPAGTALLLWAAAAGTLTLWWLHRPHAPSAPVAQASVPPASADRPVPGAIERALGHRSATPAAAAPEIQKRFQLLGVIASPSGQGSALLRIDGQPPRAFVAGQDVGEGWRLQSVRRDAAVLHNAASTQLLELPGPPKD